MVSSVVSRLDSVSSASAADRSSNAVPCARAETAWRRRSWPVNSHRRSAVQRVRSRRDPWSPVSTPLVRVPARRRHGSTVRGALPTDQDPGHSRTSRLQLGRIVAVSAGRGPCEACTTSRRRTCWCRTRRRSWASSRHNKRVPARGFAWQAPFCCAHRSLKLNYEATPDISHHCPTAVPGQEADRKCRTRRLPGSPGHPRGCRSQFRSSPGAGECAANGAVMDLQQAHPASARSRCAPVRHPHGTLPPPPGDTM